MRANSVQCVMTLLSVCDEWGGAKSCGNGARPVE